MDRFEDCVLFLSHLTCLHKLELWFDTLAEHVAFPEDKLEGCFHIKNDTILLVI